MSTWHGFSGPNLGYVLDLYERYQRDPASVEAGTRTFFEGNPPPLDLRDESAGQPMAPGAPARSRPTPAHAEDTGTVVHAARLARIIREYGHLAADLDPLGAGPSGGATLDAAADGLTDDALAALPASIITADGGTLARNALDAIRRLRATYCGTSGYDFDHVHDFAERAWLREAVESGTYRAPGSATERRALLSRLIEVEEFERFLNTTFPGQKRFSIEGVDMLVPMLDSLIHDAAAAGAREVLVGMAHRGRLNVLAHVLNKPYTTIFSEFHSAPNKDLVPSEGSMGINYGWTGDVKYHLGASRVVREGDLVRVRLTMAHNPSHLEFVDPVVEGFARAAQDDRGAPGTPHQDDNRAVAVLIHGDAAFPGEGVVAETLNLSRLPGYTTGGTVHIIANNQLGFTTSATDGRSTHYASDLAKGFEIPIIHVNADDPEACLAAVRLAYAYRDHFHRDVLVDLVGYRRWGHNEGDEPSFTQPRMYAAIAAHPTARARYTETLEAAGVVSRAEGERLRAEARDRLRDAMQALLAGVTADEPVTLHESPPLADIPTGVPAGALRALDEALLARPQGFSAVAKLERLLARRREALDKPGGIDWGHAETLAFASILADGVPIRLTGQDTERGTFSQRHLVLHDEHSGTPYTPLQALPQARASFAVYNSPLSEAAALGFEYGYSVHAPDALVLWEAQYGDFANAGQVLVDQFIVAARAKWRQHPSLVLLLPHGYEGQGPEHSSGRIERFLQLAAEDNLRIVNCTTAAQYFHALRAQAATLARAARPLVIMTPKSLLRHPRAAASLDELAAGAFQPVLEAAGRVATDDIERLVLCSGKVALDLDGARASQDDDATWIAVARVEQVYPFPDKALERVVARYPRLREVIWLQEEPRNMGAWSFIAPRLDALLAGRVPLRYVGRPERASTAEGAADVHTAEQARIVAEALAGQRAVPRVSSGSHGGRHGE